jgi:hypothetical protein
MDSGTSTQDPGEPGQRPVHGGDGVESVPPLDSPSSPLATDLTITKSDLAKLMGAVEAAILLYNAYEAWISDGAVGDDSEVGYAHEALGHALDALEVPKT